MHEPSEVKALFFTVVMSYEVEGLDLAPPHSEYKSKNKFESPVFPASIHKFLAILM